MIEIGIGIFVVVVLVLVTMYISAVTQALRKTVRDDTVERLDEDVL